MTGDMKNHLYDLLARTRRQVEPCVISPRPRILTPSIRPCGPTQDRLWISKKPRPILASTLLNIV